MRLPESRRTNLSPGARGSRNLLQKVCRRFGGGSSVKQQKNCKWYRRPYDGIESFWTSKNLFQRKKIILHWKTMLSRRCRFLRKRIFALFGLLLFALLFAVLLLLEFSLLLSFGPQYLLTISGASFLIITICTIYTIISSIIHVQTTTVRSFGSSSGTECQLPAVTYWQEDFVGRAWAAPWRALICLATR